MEFWARNCPLILPKFRLPHKFRDLLHAANLRHGTDGFTSPPKEGVLRIFFAPKNLTASAGFEPANLRTKGQHATLRSPKPLGYSCRSLMKLENVQQIFEKYSNIKFHENPSSGSRVVSCGPPRQTDRQTWRSQ